MLNLVVAGIVGLSMLFGLLGCGGGDINNKESVRAAVIAHIESRGDLRPDDLEITVQDVQFAGDTCTAQVEFVPKGSNMASGMSMTYTLKRDGDAWKVQPRVPTGGAMQSSPQAPRASAEGSAAPQLPTGHPPVPASSPQRD